jgi:2-iminobutanoate/2-iminopropanoate deaminase
MNKTIVSTDKAPKAIGPYSQAIKVGEFVYTAGQIAIDPATGEIVGGGIEAQTRRVLQNLTEVLKAAGTSMDKVIKTTVFMVNLAEFNKMNAVYSEFFPKDPPARSTVQVAALPKMGVVEIEVVAMM